MFFQQKSLKIKVFFQLKVFLFALLTLNLYNRIMKRILLKIAYDGTNFHGWQKQEGVRSVQGEIEQAFDRAFKFSSNLFASGRTDAGVHALAQMAHFDIDDAVPTNKIKLVLNRILPPDIQILSAKKVSQNFHARFDAKKKTYQYLLCTGKKNVFEANRKVYIDNLDKEKMKECASLLIGKHNFKAFCSSQTSTKDFVRTVYEIKLLQKSRHNIVVEVTGNGFLMNMVRILVGTMVDFSQGKLDKARVLRALESGERNCAGKTMPPQGLYLKKVFY